MTLTQDAKTIAYYELNFSKLAQFGEHLVCDAKKSSMSDRGLKLAIQCWLSTLHFQMYEEVYEGTVYRKGSRRNLAISRSEKKTEKRRRQEKTCNTQVV